MGTKSEETSAVAVAAAEVAPATPAAPVAAILTLDEFCTRHSDQFKKVELLSAFAFTERAAGNRRDTDAAYSARLATFATLPV